ncbi:hypothetical protein D3C71_855020 [compost metagenome]
MIRDVGMHLGIGHRPGPQLAAHILLDGRISFPADTGEAYRVAKQDVVASSAIEAVGPRQVVDGGPEDGVRQIGGRHVGLHHLITIELLQGIDGDVATDADGLQNYLVGGQERQDGQGILQRPVVAVIGGGNLEGAIPLRLQGTDGRRVPLVVVTVLRPQLHPAVGIDQHPAGAAYGGVEGLTRYIVVDVDERIELLAGHQVNDRVGILIAVIGVRRPIGDEVGQVLRIGVVLGGVAVEPVGGGLEGILVVGRTTVPITAVHTAEHALQLGQGIGILQIHADGLVGLTVEVHQEDVDLARPLGPGTVLEAGKDLGQLGLYRFHGLAADTAGAVHHESDVVVLTRQHHAAIQIPYHYVVLTAVGPVLVARLPFGGIEVAQADAVIVGGGAGLIGPYLLGDGLDLEIDLAGTAAGDSQGQPAQLHIQRTRTPQAAAGGEGDLAVGSGGAQQLVAVVEQGVLRHAAQHQAVELLAAIPIAQGGVQLDGVIDHGRLHQGQLTCALVELVDAVGELDILHVMQRLGDAGALFRDGEVEPAIIDRVSAALRDGVVGTVAGQYSDIFITSTSIESIATQPSDQNVVSNAAVEGIARH